MCIISKESQYVLIQVSLSVYMLTQKASFGEKAKHLWGRAFLAHSTLFLVNLSFSAERHTHPVSHPPRAQSSLLKGETLTALLPASQQLLICALRFHLQLKTTSEGRHIAGEGSCQFPTHHGERVGSDTYDSSPDGSSWPLCCQEYTGH